MWQLWARGFASLGGAGIFMDTLTTLARFGAGQTILNLSGPGISDIGKAGEAGYKVIHDLDAQPALDMIYSSQPGIRAIDNTIFQGKIEDLIDESKRDKKRGSGDFYGR
jgi:hypothetical protein